MISQLLLGMILAQATPTPSSPPTPGKADSSMTESPPVAAPPARKVRVLIDRFKESGGTVVRDDDSVLTIRTPEGIEKSFEKSLLLGVFPVLDAPEGTGVIIQFRDGRRVNAELVRDELHQARVRIAKVEVVLARETFWALELAPTYEELLAQNKANIPATAWPQRLRLAQWMLEQNHPQDAQEELERIVVAYDTQEAHDMLSRARDIVKQHNAQSGSVHAGGVKPAKDAREPILPTHRLSPDEVNLIKVFEVDMDRPTRMEAAPDLAKKIIARYGDSPALPADPDARKAMEGWSPQQLLKLLFALKARDLYQDIQIEGEPPALELFHQRVHDNWLIPNCATSRCHGGAGAGNFLLFAADYKSERTRYTNLLNLLRAPQAQGRPPMIDFEHPEQSLLIQHARPRIDAKFPHPDVQGWKPVFAPGRESLQKDALNWIRSMHRPRVEYPIEYNPPSLVDLTNKSQGTSPDR